MLHHGSDSDRCHCKNGCDIKFAEEEFRNTNNRCACYSCKTEDSTSICVCHACCIHDQGYYIRHYNTHQNRNNTEHADSPDIKENNSSKCHQGKQPVLGCIADSRWCKAETNADNDRTGYNRRQITHNSFYTDRLYDQGKNQIQKSCHKYTATCIWKLLSIGHVSKDSCVQLCHCGKSAQKCK